MMVLVSVGRDSLFFILDFLVLLRKRTPKTDFMTTNDIIQCISQSVLNFKYNKSRKLQADIISNQCRGELDFFALSQILRVGAEKIEDNVLGAAGLILFVKL